MLAVELSFYPDRVLAEEIVLGFTRGFPLHFYGPIIPLISTNLNAWSNRKNFA
jgi:hypothetical protein